MQFTNDGCSLLHGLCGHYLYCSCHLSPVAIICVLQFVLLGVLPRAILHAPWCFLVGCLVPFFVLQFVLFRVLLRAVLCAPVRAFWCILPRAILCVCAPVRAFWCTPSCHFACSSSCFLDRGYHCLYKSRYHVTPTKGSVRLHFVRITLLCTRVL